ncbi:MAG: hypothetical protein JWL81_884, partial [Verrucomicrobiales bacterium]|nr:hypothetical protein [Verrucomicrobiales bacterium]
MFIRPLLFAACLIAGAIPSPVSAQALADWLPQLNFRPAPGLQSNLMSRPAVADKGIWHFQKIEAGIGPLCTDLHAFTVVRAPQAAGREMKPSEILNWARVHLGDFLDPAMATCSVSGFHDQYRWESDASAAGAVVRLNLATADPPGPAYLAVTEQNAGYFVLTGVHASTADSRDYPVSGNRWIGWTDAKNGGSAADEAPSGSKPKPSNPKNATPAKPSAPGRSFTIYTRAAWRVQSGTDPAKADAIIAREDALWKGFTERLQAFITEQGGQCAPASLICGQFQQEWEPVRNSNNFTPFINWMDPEGSWTSTDPKKRFQLVIHPGFTTCEFIERAGAGREIRQTVPILPAAAGEGWKVERSSVSPEVLDFLGFDKK